MKKTIKKRIPAILAAVLICSMISGPAVFAAEKEMPSAGTAIPTESVQPSGEENADVDSVDGETDCTDSVNEGAGSPEADEGTESPEADDAAAESAGPDDEDDQAQDPVSTDPEDGESEQAESEQAEPEQAESEQEEPEQAESEQAESEQTESEQAEPEQAESEQAEPEQSESEQEESEQTQPDPAGDDSSDPSLLAETNPVSIDTAVITGIEDKTYTGRKIKQSITVTLPTDTVDIVLQKGTDYTVSYQNNIEAGKATLTVKGIGNYEGSVSRTFRIKHVKLTSLELAYPAMTWTGEPVTQSGQAVVQAKVDGETVTLVRGTDFVLHYTDNTNIGMASVTAEGIGNFKGTVSASFKIRPIRTSLSAVTPGTEKIVVSWAKQTKKTTGYQLQVSEEDDFDEILRSWKTTDNTRTSVTVKGLEVGERYYVRIRTFKTVGGKNYYSKWSAVKSGKIRRNAISVTGTGSSRTVVLDNPKASAANVRVAVWSETGGQDDLKWYNMKQRADGSWYVKISAVYLKHSGQMYAHVYSDAQTFIGEKLFRFTKAEYNLVINTIRVSGTGDARLVKLLCPGGVYKSVRVAIWTEEGGQDDIKWYDLKKQSDGTWKGKISMLNLRHSGNAFVHVYANKNTFLGEKIFTAPVVGFPICSSEEEYITGIAPAVQKVCKKYGYLPSVLIAQSCLENGYGIPEYWDNPEIAALMRYNNMVGLKSELLNSSWADKTVWPGESVVKQTPEEYNGQHVIITDSFRIYDNIEQSFADFLLFLTYASNYGAGGTPKYGREVITIKDPEKLIKAVAGRGYATSSSYPTSVMKIINKHNLTKYDNLKGVSETEY